MLLKATNRFQQLWDKSWSVLWERLPPRKAFADVRLKEFVDDWNLQGLMSECDSLFHEDLGSVFTLLEREAIADKQRTQNYLDVRERISRQLFAGRKLEQVFSEEEALFGDEQEVAASDLVRVFTAALRARDERVLFDSSIPSLRDAGFLSESERKEGTNLCYCPMLSFQKASLLTWQIDVDTTVWQCHWNYRASFMTLMTRFLEFANSVEQEFGRTGQEHNVTVYADGRVHHTLWSTRHDPGLLVDKIAIDCGPEPDYLRFRHPLFDFFVEIAPFSSGSDLLEVAIRSSEDLADALAWLHFHTAVTRLDPTILVGLLKEYRIRSDAYVDTRKPREGNHDG